MSEDKIRDAIDNIKFDGLTVRDTTYPTKTGEFAIQRINYNGVDYTIDYTMILDTNDLFISIMIDKLFKMNCLKLHKRVSLFNSMLYTIHMYIDDDENMDCATISTITSITDFTNFSVDKLSTELCDTLDTISEFVDELIKSKEYTHDMYA